MSVDQVIAKHDRAGHGAIQHRSGVRTADDRISRNELLDGVQLAHFVADPGFAGSVEVYPSLAFDSLFENRGSLRNMSILDRVKDERAAMCREISSADKVKLDEYLTSVREVEKRVDDMRKSKDEAEDIAKLKKRPVFSMERPANGLPEDLREHARLMCDIIAIGLPDG